MYISFSNGYTNCDKLTGSRHIVEQGKLFTELFGTILKILIFIYCISFVDLLYFFC